MNQFITQHEQQILGVLNGWDRVRFRGTLRVLSCVPGLFVWMLEQKVLLKEFAGFCQGLTDRWKQSIQGGQEPFLAKLAGKWHKRFLTPLIPFDFFNSLMSQSDRQGT